MPITDNSISNFFLGETRKIAANGAYDGIVENAKL